MSERSAGQRRRGRPPRARAAEACGGARCRAPTREVSNGAAGGRPAPSVATQSDELVDLVVPVVDDKHVRPGVERIPPPFARLRTWRRRPRDSVPRSWPPPSSRFASDTATEAKVSSDSAWEPCTDDAPMNATRVRSSAGSAGNRSARMLPPTVLRQSASPVGGTDGWWRLQGGTRTGLLLGQQRVARRRAAASASSSTPATVRFQLRAWMGPRFRMRVPMRPAAIRMPRPRRPGANPLGDAPWSRCRASGTASADWSRGLELQPGNAPWGSGRRRDPRSAARSPLSAAGAGRATSGPSPRVQPGQRAAVHRPCRSTAMPISSSTVSAGAARSSVPMTTSLTTSGSQGARCSSFHRHRGGGVSCHAPAVPRRGRLRWSTRSATTPGGCDPASSRTASLSWTGWSCVGGSEPATGQVREGEAGEVRPQSLPGRRVPAPEPAVPRWPGSAPARTGPGLQGVPRSGPVRTSTAHQRGAKRRVRMHPKVFDCGDAGHQPATRSIGQHLLEQGLRVPHGPTADLFQPVEIGLGG